MGNVVKQASPIAWSCNVCQNEGDSVDFSLCLPVNEGGSFSILHEEDEVKTQSVDRQVNTKSKKVVDTPETNHPVAVNTFDKLTQIHLEIHQQLALQESMIQKLLRDGDQTDENLQQIPTPHAEQKGQSSELESANTLRTEKAMV